MEVPSYHPFKSAKAKAKFLNLYESWEKEWPIASENKIVDTGYGQTFVRISGSAGAPPLVLLHGYSTTSVMWAPNVEGLSEHYRTYAVDTINDIGRSVNTRIVRNRNDLIAWLDDLFNSLGLDENINLVGQSYGGWLTSLYAMRFGDRLAKIVLLAPGATVLPFSYAFRFRSLLARLPHPYFSKRMMYWLFSDQIKKDNATFEKRSYEKYIALRCYNQKKLLLPSVLKDQELQSIRVPALFLVGENEKVYSAQKAVQRLSRVAPQIKTEVLADTGHGLTFTQVKLINKKVLDFLGEGKA